MAIYHLSVKAVSRSAGRSATAAAAYRAGCEIADERTGEVHDYRRKRGVESADIVLPDGAPAWAQNRERLWNAAELAEKRKDSCVAREYEVALPHELSPAERRQLVLEFAKDMANKEGCAVDVAIHAPGKEGDHRNHHAHILRTTRKVGPDGLTDKLDSEKSGRDRKADLEAVRARWADMCNAYLREKKIEARVDHRSLKDQGIDREPTSHLGPSVVALERRGVNTKVKQRIVESLSDRLRGVEKSAAKMVEHVQVKAQQVVGTVKTGIDEFRAKFEAHKQEQARKAEQERQQRIEQERARQEAERKRGELERAQKAAEYLKQQAAKPKPQPTREQKQDRDNDGPSYGR